VVVGDATLARVHLHCDDPEPVFAEAATLGALSRVKAEDMAAQHGRFQQTGSGAGARIALLALSPGPGFDSVFESLGAHTAPLGEVVKPAAGDIARAADALGVPDVIVLPNHRNVLMAARQAAGLARCKLSVVPSESLPQGIAAAVAFDAGEALASNLADMAEAMREVVTIEVTIAAADRRADGLSVRAGDSIALINGRLIARAASPGEALIGALNRVAEDGSGLITVFVGKEAAPGEADVTRERLGRRFRDATVEVVEGGQPLYHFIASVER
jgi:dihydroxyacetone kinase-like predicted kinase